MISMVVAAYKNSKHATCDVTSAYLHAVMDDFVAIKIQGQIVDILCAKNPSYEEFVVMENGKRMSTQSAIWMYQVGITLV